MIDSPVFVLIYNNSALYYNSICAGFHEAIGDVLSLSVATPKHMQAIGFMNAIKYVNKIGMTHIRQHDLALLEYAESQLSAHRDIVIYGRSPNKAGVISFTIDGVHPHDIGTVLDNEGIAARAASAA